MNEITLSEFIKELQTFEEKYGNWSVSSLGRTSGIVGELESPLTLMLHDYNSEKPKHQWIYVAARSNDVGKKGEELYEEDT